MENRMTNYNRPTRNTRNDLYVREVFEIVEYETSYAVLEFARPDKSIMRLQVPLADLMNRQRMAECLLNREYPYPEEPEKAKAVNRRLYDEAMSIIADGRKRLQTARVGWTHDFKSFVLPSETLGD